MFQNGQQKFSVEGRQLLVKEGSWTYVDFNLLSAVWIGTGLSSLSNVVTCRRACGQPQHQSSILGTTGEC